MTMQPKALSATNSPLTEEQAAQLNSLVSSLNPDQIGWVSGYLAGVQAMAEGAGAATQPVAAADPVAEPSTLTILYGSESGNAEGLAHDAGERAKEKGLPVRVMDMADYKQRELREEQLVLVVTATHGEGDPPDPATDFYEFVHGRKAPKLEGTKFAVIALGDSSYEHFCQTGRDFDKRLEELGAERLRDCLECDVDFEAPANEWLPPALDAFLEHSGGGGQADNVVPMPGQEAGTAKPQYDRKNPFPAEVLDNICLNGRGSERDTRHIELSLEGSGLDYKPGDILGVVAENRDATVDAIIDKLGLDPAVNVATDEGDKSLRDALKFDYEITTLTPGLISAYAELADADELRALAGEDNRKALTAYMSERQLVDVVTEYPVEGMDPQNLVGMLRRLQPREYSIASSHEANPGEVHITVAAVRYERDGEPRYGVASTYLADDIEPGSTVPVFIRANKNFALPDDPNAPTIMVGPGTGVAPYRAFLQEREEHDAPGANWLFFGNRHFRTDFLYQIEWQKWLKEGVLDRMDVAFSRDGAEKVYVQDRLREHGADVYQWLEDGAYFYVCGDAEYMAPAVHQALIDVVSEHGGRSPEAAEEYVKQLQRDKRYQRDVY
jgi:sulfite reductase (NADPH) flavoprotein alpha-component